MTMRRTAFATLTLVSLLAACATKPETPDWVNGTSSKFPTNEYLTGRGQADSAEQARDRARADLAKIFQVKVEATSEDVQTYKGGTGQAGEYQTETKRAVSASTDQIVRGIDIGDQWQDPQTKTYHALATLSRLSAGNALRQQINDLDAATGRYVEQARNAPDLMGQIQAASQALDTQLERTELQRSLRIVDITGRGLEPEYKVSQLQADLTGLLKRVRIKTVADNDSPKGFSQVVQGAAAAAGFNVASGNPEYVLEGRLSLNDLGKIDGVYWQRGTLEVTLKDVVSNNVRGTQRWTVKASARDRASAVDRAVDESNKILRADLRPTVLGFMIAKAR